MNEKKRFKHSLLFPTFFLVIIWFVKFYEYTLNVDFSEWGIYPLSIIGLRGIIFSPLLHADFNHLISNSISLYILSVGLFYFFRKYSYQIFSLIYFITGVLVWIIARDAIHIGASGIIYGLAAFIFFSGILSKKREYIAVSLVVVLQYGSMVWGMFPTQGSISWESHLMGFITGIFLAVIYNKKINAEQNLLITQKTETQENLYDFKNISKTEDIEIEYVYKEKEQKVTD